jgi:hypothetical protein
VRTAQGGAPLAKPCWRHRGGTEQCHGPGSCTLVTLKTRSTCNRYPRITGHRCGSFWLSSEPRPRILRIPLRASVHGSTPSISILTNRFDLSRLAVPRLEMDLLLLLPELTAALSRRGTQNTRLAQWMFRSCIPLPKLGYGFLQSLGRRIEINKIQPIEGRGQSIQ